MGQYGRLPLATAGFLVQFQPIKKIQTVSDTRPKYLIFDNLCVVCKFGAAF